MRVIQCRKEEIVEYNFENDRPIYIQIVEKIRTQIVAGTLMQGQRLLSVRELALEYRVNPNTMQKALAELEEEGLVFTERTNGKFVTEDKKLIQKVKKELAKEKVTKYINEMNDIGIVYAEAIKYLQEFGGK